MKNWAKERMWATVTGKAQMEQTGGVHAAGAYDEWNTDREKYNPIP